MRLREQARSVCGKLSIIMADRKINESDNKSFIIGKDDENELLADKITEKSAGDITGVVISLPTKCGKLFKVYKRK